VVYLLNFNILSYNFKFFIINYDIKKDYFIFNRNKSIIWEYNTYLHNFTKSSVQGRVGKMHRNNLVILVVDDQPGVRYLLDIIIKEAGHKVYTAQNGLEAVEKVRALRPDLIFMDVRMPLMGGLEALAKIKLMNPETKVVIMTAYVSDDTIDQARKQGALHCLAKPFDVEDIKNFLADFTRDYIENYCCKANAI